MDSVTPETRSRVMARVRSRGNRSTEWRLRAALVQAGIRGWTLDPSGLPGKPDFVFHENSLASFVDGCFWHGCPKCFRRPSSNTVYWDAKIGKNRARDSLMNRKLRSAGWKVLRIPEHQLADLASVIRKIRFKLDT